MPRDGAAPIVVDVKVRKAIIPAAGLGTRFLPATKVLPKEMIPIVDRPGIQWAVEECVRAGITDVCIVTSLGKSLIKDHFDHTPDLEKALEAKGKTSELEAIKRISAMATIHYVHQDEPLGLGHAVLQASGFTGEDPFVVLLPDEIVPEPLGDEPYLIERMIDLHQSSGLSVVAVAEIPKEDVVFYGIIDPEFVEKDVARIKDFVEKPSLDEAPSNLKAVGRYLLTADVMEALASTRPGHGNEIQLTDAIMRVVEGAGALAYVYSGPIYDVGRKLDFIKSTVQLALRRDDVAEPLRAMLRSLDER